MLQRDQARVRARHEREAEGPPPVPDEDLPLHAAVRVQANQLVVFPDRYPDPAAGVQRQRPRPPTDAGFPLLVQAPPVDCSHRAVVGVDVEHPVITTDDRAGRGGSGRGRWMARRSDEGVGPHVSANRHRQDNRVVAGLAVGVGRPVAGGRTARTAVAEVPVIGGAVLWDGFEDRSVADR